MHTNLKVLIYYFAPLLLLVRKLGLKSFIQFYSVIEDTCLAFHCKDILLNMKGSEVVQWSGDIIEENEFKREVRLIPRFDSATIEMLVNAGIFYQQVKKNECAVLAGTFTGVFDDVTGDSSKRLKYSKGQSDQLNVLQLGESALFNVLLWIAENNFAGNGKWTELMDQHMDNLKEELYLEHERCRENDGEIEELREFLKVADKRRLIAIGIEVEDHFFKKRAMDLVDEFKINPKWTQIGTCSHFFIEFFNRDSSSIPSRNNTTEIARRINENFVVPFPDTVNRRKVEEWIVSGWISAILSFSRSELNYLKDKLSEIDSHPSSAKRLKATFGSDYNYEVIEPPAAYPVGLIEILMANNKISEFKELFHEHEEGMEAALYYEREKIFGFIYRNNDLQDPRKPLLNLLLEYGFIFKENHKKVLLKHAIEHDDLEFLKLLLRKKVIDLYSYIPDRGVTPLHLILIEGSDRMIDYFTNTITVLNADQQIKFIPCYSVYDYSGPPYWKAYQNNFNVKPPNFLNLASSSIRKGWDYLILAAARGQFNFAYRLINIGAETARYSSIEAQLANQSGSSIQTLISLQRKEILSREDVESEIQESI